jgi:hypothetical protein
MNKFNETYFRIISEMNEKHLIKEDESLEENVEETETQEDEVETECGDTVAIEEDEDGEI